MTKYFLFKDFDGDLKLVNVDDIISLTLNAPDFIDTETEQAFELHIKGEAPCYFSIPYSSKHINADEAIKLIKVMMYNMATQKHPVFDWEDFCRNRTKLGG